MKAVCFDLFETLITEYEGGRRKAPRLSVLDEGWGVSLPEYNEAWSARVKQRMDGTFEDFPAVLRDIWASKGKTLDEKHIQTMYQARLNAKALAYQPINPEILYLLKQLKSRGYRLGLISNCTEEEVQAWSSCPLSPYFDAVLFSYQQGCAKPEPLLYKQACIQLNVAPEEAVFVGDGGSQELEGASLAGLLPYHAVWFLPSRYWDRVTGFPKLQRPHELLNHLLPDGW
ncbi:HAD family hydrolase [Paenibacillus sp. TAB 01]|uniref:HAD family hydrolase n=1 Tax=Paenibacillus sp. TAB 01 TaxID=3368988 RepID=UPI003751EE82